MKKIVRTDEEIKKEIERICKDSDNFTIDNYGSKASDDGFFETTYSEFNSINTLTDFIKWLTNKNA